MHDCRLFGDYESLEAGKCRDALVDMMGGVGEGVEMEEYSKDEAKKKKLFEELEEAYENHSLMSASMSVSHRYGHQWLSGCSINNVLS